MFKTPRLFVPCTCCKRHVLLINKNIHINLQIKSTFNWNGDTDTSGTLCIINTKAFRVRVCIFYKPDEAAICWQRRQLIDSLCALFTFRPSYYMLNIKTASKLPEVIMLLIYIREVLGLNLNRATDCPD
jgi:hypothetical protein